jgi:hypothetical protein
MGSTIAYDLQKMHCLVHSGQEDAETKIADCMRQYIHDAPVIGTDSQCMIEVVACRLVVFDLSIYG